MSNNNGGLKSAPFRSLNDFLFDFDKYSRPTFNDMKRLNNRVTSNLLYYQTNYFVVSAAIFLLFLMFGFKKILLGAIGPLALLVDPNLVADWTNIPGSTRLQHRDLIYWGFKLACGLIMMLTFRPLLYFKLSLLIPIAACIIHASIKCRGLKNKLSNKMEQIGAPIYTNTPMGYVLSALGLETKIIDD